MCRQPNNVNEVRVLPQRRAGGTARAGRCTARRTRRSTAAAAQSGASGRASSTRCCRRTSCPTPPPGPASLVRYKLRPHCFHAHDVLVLIVGLSEHWTWSYFCGTCGQQWRRLPNAQSTLCGQPRLRYSKITQNPWQRVYFCFSNYGNLKL